MNEYDVFFEEGNITTIIGLPKHGMTNMSLLLLERMHEKGYRIYTNVKVLK